MTGWSIAATLLLSAPSGAAASPVAVADGSSPAPSRPEALPSGGADFHGAMLDWSAKAGTDARVRSGGPAGLAAPLPLGRLSSTFGLRRDPLGSGVRSHWGIDIPDPRGTPVLAAAGGVVTFAGWSRGYGNLVRIDHGSGSETRYGHLSAYAVRRGTVLREGEVIGSVGSTGHATGSHLHFEVRQDGLPVDPLSRLGRGESEAEMLNALSPPVPHWAGFGPGGEALPLSELR